jgi:hypothetical protein
MTAAKERSRGRHKQQFQERQGLRRSSGGHSHLYKREDDNKGQLNNPRK